MKTTMARSVAVAVTVSFMLQLVACGTLMYPERRGQKAGEIDVKVAVLDGLGLLFGIIPGVVAYIVDFDTGAIYLPAGQRNRVSLENGAVATIRVNPESLRDPAAVRQIVSREMGLSEAVDWSRLELAAVPKDQIALRLAEAQAVGYAR